MASEPRITVIVRTRNRPTQLAEALGSLRDQTWRDFDVVVVNDGGTAPVIPLDLGVPCRVVETDEPRGRARALNTGVRAARGVYVAYLDDDDLFLPDHLETLARFLDGTDQYEAAYTDVDIVEQELGDDGRYTERTRRAGFGRDFVPGRIQFSNFIPLISLMHTRSLFERVGPFDESFDLFEDWDFLIRLTQVARAHHLKHVTALYRIRDDGTNAVTSSPWGSGVSQASRRRIYEKHWALHTPELEMETIDALERDIAAALPWQPRALEAEAHASRLEEAIARLKSDILGLRADSARMAQFGSERESTRQEREAMLTQLRDEVARLARERDTLTVSLRQAYEAGTALHFQLDAVHRSLAWRLFSPYWRFKAWLRR